MNKSIIYSLLLGLILLLPAGLAGCRDEKPVDRISIADALSSVTDQACFKAADQPINITFPGDSGPHDLFRTEWWYYTGNLKAENGRQFGFQLTFFRQALSCDPVAKGSKWRTRQIYFAHFGLTDVENDRFYSMHRMNRESIGIAGATPAPFKVWVDNWHASETEKNIHLFAVENTITIDLALKNSATIVYQGKQGLSRKGPNPSNASYYYSIPRMATSGTITIGSKTFNVRGLTWFDHEWSTSALNTDVTGWDWFSVHLDDGRDLMVCRIRNQEGESNGFGFGSISYSDGKYEILSENDFSIISSSTWKSPASGNIYPDKWQITLAGRNIDLMVTTLVSNQEHTHSLTYWEGAARFVGKDTQGLGYIELTGY